MRIKVIATDKTQGLGVTVTKPVFGKLVTSQGYGNEARIGNVEGLDGNVTVTEKRNGHRNHNRYPEFGTGIVAITELRITEIICEIRGFLDGVD